MSWFLYILLPSMSFIFAVIFLSCLFIAKQSDAQSEILYSLFSEQEPERYLPAHEKMV